MSGTIAGRSALSGTVTGGDGLTRFDRVTGTQGVNTNNFRTPPFVLNNPIQAMVVDRLLDSDTGVGTTLADAVAEDLGSRR